jgi:hypothetical protein
MSNKTPDSTDGKIKQELEFWGSGECVIVDDARVVS